MSESTTPELKKLLKRLPRQRILALANSLHAITTAQVAAGKKLTADEQAMYDRARASLSNLNSRR